MNAQEYGNRYYAMHTGLMWAEVEHGRNPDQSPDFTDFEVLAGCGIFPPLNRWTPEMFAVATAMAEQRWFELTTKDQK
jgi:hypothetical protein